MDGQTIPKNSERQSPSDDETYGYAVIPSNRCTPMPEIHREAIRKMQRIFVQDLDVADIMPHMVEGGVISDKKRDDILARSTRIERVETFLDILKRSGSNALPIFQDALLDSNYPHLYETLKEQLQLQMKEDKEKDNQEYENIKFITGTLNKEQSSPIPPTRPKDEYGQKTNVDDFYELYISQSDDAYINGLARRASVSSLCPEITAASLVCKETCTVNIIHLQGNGVFGELAHQDQSPYRPLPPIPQSNPQSTNRHAVCVEPNLTPSTSGSENREIESDVARNISSLSLSSSTPTSASSRCETITLYKDDVLFLDESEGQRKRAAENIGGLTHLQVWDKYGNLLKVPSSKLKMYGDPSEETWFYPKPVFSSHVDLMLRDYKKPGVFLIYKPLHTNDGTARDHLKNILFNMAIVVYKGSKYRIVHYPIKGSPGGPVIMLDLVKFSCIQDLVMFHKGNRGSLPCRLQHPPRTADKPILPGERYDIKWHIPEEALEYTETNPNKPIWIGQTGRIVLAFKDNIPVAVKIQTARQQVDPWATESFFEEASILSKMDHKNIVQLYGFSMEKTPLIVLEYFQRTLLEGLKNGVVNKSYRNVCQMLSQLLMALQYLESLAYVIHCNVAAKNILFQDSNLKLADFSFARMVVDDGFYAEENAQIPTRHSSPEVSLNLLF